jgi:hypothetical protein
VCHRCDVPACVNPEHLFIGTAFDNMRDAMRKGRLKLPTNKGNRNPRAVLTKDQVIAIRKEYDEVGTSHRCLAMRYGVAKRTIGKLLVGQTWSS